MTSIEEKDPSALIASISWLYLDRKGKILVSSTNKNKNRDGIAR